MQLPQFGQLCDGHIPTLGQDNSGSEQHCPWKEKVEPGAVQDTPCGMQHRPLAEGTPFASTQGLLKQWLLLKTQSMRFVQISPKLP
jgi:hypothetical protein